MKNLSMYDESRRLIDSHVEKIKYHMGDIRLTIYYSDYTKPYRKKADLLNFLLGHKIMYAPSLGENKFVYLDRVFQFNNLHESILMQMGQVTLKYIGRLVDHASPKKDFYFLHKYYKFKFLNVLE